MIFLRSVVFQIYLVLLTLVMGVLLFWTLLAPRVVARESVRLWACLVLGGLRVLCGIRHDIRGFHHVPSGGCLIASKHQSMWDTLIPFLLFEDPAIVLKRELMHIPIYGWWARKLDMIPIDRSSGAKAVRAMRKAAQRAGEQGRQIIIFPEGTRKAPGDPPDYKPGVAGLYSAANVACVPAGLLSGLNWINGSIRRVPGTIVMEFAEPIPPGLNRKVFTKTLEERIEALSDTLLEEARAAGRLEHDENKPLTRVEEEA